jgi:hypothetical protein
MHFSFVPELCRHLLHLIIQFLTFFRSHYSKSKRSGAVVEPKTLNSSTQLIPGWPHAISPMDAGAPSARPLDDADANGSASGRLGAEKFTKAFAQHGYGYGSQQLLQSRGSQFPQLSGITYLDHAAATLCSKQQLQETQAEQLQHLLANPHSQLPSGLDYSAMAIEELRLLTLNMLNAPADEYEVGCCCCCCCCSNLSHAVCACTRSSCSSCSSC